MNNINNPLIRFTKDTHTYTTDGFPCYSVNTIKDYFKDKMDEEYWKKYKAVELCVPKFKELKRERFKFPQIARPPVDWLDELIDFYIPDYMYESAYQDVCSDWQASKDDGTDFHDEREAEMYQKGFAVNPWDNKEYPVKEYKKSYDNQSIIQDLGNLEYGCYPELLVFQRAGDIFVTGQADVVYVTEDKYIYIDDYKTNKKFSRSKSSRKYYKPFEHLDTSKFTNYAIQMSMYAYILETAGFKVRNVGLHHYKNYDVSTAKKYDLPYYKDEVKDMMKLFSENHKIVG